MDTDGHGSKKLNAESQRTRRNAERKSFATFCVLCASAFFPIRVYLCASEVKTLLDSSFRLLYLAPYVRNDRPPTDDRRRETHASAEVSLTSLPCKNAPAN